MEICFSQGRGDGGGASGTSGKAHKCVGVHCGDGEWAETFLIVVTVAAVLYVGLGVGYAVHTGKQGSVIPNRVFWSSVGGLVIDGVQFTYRAASGKPRVPYTRLAALEADAESPAVVVANIIEEPDAPTAPKGPSGSPRNVKRGGKGAVGGSTCAAKRVRKKKEKAKVG